MRERDLMTAVTCALVAWLLPAPTQAHWCSNIYQTYARIVVKPDRSTLSVGVEETVELKVRVRNNFPYTLRYLKLRANPPEGLQVSILPSEAEAERWPVVAGQEVTFTLEITRTADGTDDVDTLGLEISTMVEDVQPRWRDAMDNWVDPDPDPQDLLEHQRLGLHQARAITWARLARLDCPGCQAEGLQGLMDLWAARLDPCEPAGFNSPWPMQFLRAGHQLAIHLRFGSFDQADRSAVVQTMISAMDDAHDIARGFAAFLAAYGGQDEGVASRIRAMAEADPDGACRYSPSPRAQRMAQAALLMMGEIQHLGTVTDCVADENQHQRVRMVCAAALGVMGEDQPIENYLLGQVPNGMNMSHDRMFASYLLQLVVLARRGGPDGIGEVTFLAEEARPDAGVDPGPDGGPIDPPQDPGGGCSTTGGPAGQTLVVGLLLLGFIRKCRERGW